MSVVPLPKFYVRVNDKEECWEVVQRAAAWTYDFGVEDAVIARFYDGDTRRSFLADLLAAMLNVNPESGWRP